MQTYTFISFPPIITRSLQTWQCLSQNGAHARTKISSIPGSSSTSSMYSWTTFWQPSDNKSSFSSKQFISYTHTTYSIFSESIKTQSIVNLLPMEQYSLALNSTDTTYSLTCLIAPSDLGHRPPHGYNNRKSQVKKWIMSECKKKFAPLV